LIGAGTLVAQEGTPESAIARMRANTYDVVLCDLVYGGEPRGLAVIEAAAALASPTTAAPAVVILSAFDAPGLVARVLAAGGAGFLPKTSSAAEIAAAVRTAADGGAAYPPGLLAAARRVAGRLCERERGIIARIAAGATNKEIAHALGIADKTLEALVARLFARLGARSRAELVAIAVREGEIAL
jgi:DNA-binding NarL/FixJ family response regulator